MWGVQGSGLRVRELGSFTTGLEASGCGCAGVWVVL